MEEWKPLTVGPAIVCCCSECAVHLHATRDENGAAAALAALAAAVAVVGQCRLTLSNSRRKRLDLTACN